MEPYSPWPHSPALAVDVLDHRDVEGAGAAWLSAAPQLLLAVGTGAAGKRGLGTGNIVGKGGAAAGAVDATGYCKGALDVVVVV